MSALASDDVFADQYSKRQQYAADDQLVARFYNHAKLDQQKSDEANRPVYEDAVYIEIRIPGQQDTVINRPVRPGDAQRFAQQWRQFQANEEQTSAGTPLDLAPFISHAQRMELKHFGVNTIEALANMADSSLQNFMAGSMLKRKAQEFLGAAPVSSELEEKVAAQEKELQELRAMVDQQTAPVEESVTEEVGNQDLDL